MEGQREAGTPKVFMAVMRAGKDPGVFDEEDEGEEGVYKAESS